MKRKPLSKRVRFEVFKRDSFTCQYCGRKPPAVVLQCDHILAVANGGTNDESNLATSCQDCNSGKNAVPLTKKPKPLAEIAEFEQEKWEQLEAYNEFLAHKARSIESMVKAVSDAWVIADGDDPKQFSLKDAPARSVRLFVKRLPIEQVLEAVDIAFGKRIQPSDRFRYFCGVCWKRIRDNQREAA